MQWSAQRDGIKDAVREVFEDEVEVDFTPDESTDAWLNGADDEDD